MATALVTGSAGFIGRHFETALREQGWNVHGLDIAHGEDARDLFRYGTPVSYDLVVHAAAVVGGRQIIDNDPLAQAVNFELDAGLFAWAARARPRRVLYFSSSAAYPVELQDGSARGTRRSLKEADIDLGKPALPDQLYGWAKLTGERLAAYARAKGVGVTVVRPFSGYGPDQDSSYPFPAFIDRALAKEDPFLIWGDGQQVRDFIHVADIVRVSLELVQADDNGPVNLCSGAGTSMEELARLVYRQAGYDPKIEFVPSAPSGVPYRVGDDTRAYAWRRGHVPLVIGVNEALQYRRGPL
jgi:nucleoside-diphosphate-sugar epimerase